MDNLEKVDHVAIAVHDIESAVNWYQTSSKCKVIYQDELQAILEYKNVKLQLVMPSYLPPHIAFSREDAQTLGELRKRADGTNSCFLSDSSGNPVEIVKPL